MAWVVARQGSQGTKFKACYRDPSGAERSAGTYSSRRAAERAGQREEQRVREGRWHDYSLGATTFRDYVEKTWLPSKHMSSQRALPITPIWTSTSFRSSATARWAEFC